MQDFLTVDELAARLKVDKSWLYSRTRQKGAGAIPCVRVGKYMRFDEQAVMDWLKGGNQGREGGARAGRTRGPDRRRSANFAWNARRGARRR